MKQHVALPACVTQMYFIYFRSCYWVLRLNFFWLQFASEDDGEERGRIFFFLLFFFILLFKAVSWVILISLGTVGKEFWSTKSLPALFFSRRRQRLG